MSLNQIHCFQDTSKELTDIVDQLGQMSESAQNAKIIKSAYLEMERINEKVDQVWPQTANFLAQYTFFENDESARFLKKFWFWNK